MNIKFEWIDTQDKSSHYWSCWLGLVQLGGVNANESEVEEAWFGDTLDRTRRHLWEDDFATVDEAKDWVESKAREWFASVLQEAARG